jgi:glycosyltransferase involved in cell wall biosynthesis
VFVRAAPRATRPAARLLLDPLFARARTLFGRLSAITGISDAYVNWALALRGGGAIPSAAFLPAVRIGACDPARWTRTASTGPMRLVYAGALGHQYDLETILACARRLHDAGTANVDFHIAGDGPKAGAVRAAAAELPNVIFHGWLNGDALARLFSMSDVALACYRRGATQSVTYKLFDYTGSGLPILCSLPGEMSELLARENAGCFVPPEDVDALTARVTRLANDRTAVAEMSGNARRVAERDGDARVVYRRMAAFLEDVAGCGARPSRLVDEGATMSVP